MTKTEAATLLGVQEDAPPDQVRRRYEELHNDFHVRLTNAPTPSLKKAYQRNLQELQEAGELLAPGIATRGDDLPSPEPVGGENFGSARSATGRTRASSVRTTAPVEPSASPGLARSTIAAAAAAAVFLALAAYLLILLQGANERARLAGAALAELQVTTDGLSKRYAAFEYADALRVKNLSSRPITITTLSVTHVDPATGQLKAVHSGTFGYPTWEIRPGGTARVDAEIGRGRDWNGPVIFYSLIIDYPGVEPFLKAGLWLKDIDPFEKALPVDLD